MQDAAGNSPAIMPGPITDEPPAGYEPVTTPGTDFPSPPVGNFPGDPEPGVGVPDGPISVGPVPVIACGIEAGIEICRYNPANPDQTTGPFTCMGNWVWHHCIEPVYPAPSLPALPLPVRPKAGPCVEGPAGPGKWMMCALVGSRSDGIYKHCTYNCPDGTQVTLEIPACLPCDAMFARP